MEIWLIVFPPSLLVMPCHVHQPLVFVECCKGFHAGTLHLVVEKVGPPWCFIKQLPIHYKAEFQSNGDKERLANHLGLCITVLSCRTVCHRAVSSGVRKSAREGG